MYTILEAHQEFKDGQLSLVAVLWVSNPEFGWVRASYCTTQPRGGYKFLLPNEVLNNTTLQSVAGLGMNSTDEIKEKYFPGVKQWEQ